MTRSALQKSGLDDISWPLYVSSIQTQPGKLSCPNCEKPTCEPVMTSVAHSQFLFIEFSPELMNGIHLYEIINVGKTEYQLKGMVRSYNRHFTCAVLIEGKWNYIDDLCSGVKQCSNLISMKQQFSKGWFFTIYEIKQVVCKRKESEAVKKHIKEYDDFIEVLTKKRRRSLKTVSNQPGKKKAKLQTSNINVDVSNKLGKKKAKLQTSNINVDVSNQPGKKKAKLQTSNINVEKTETNSEMPVPLATKKPFPTNTAHAVIKEKENVRPGSDAELFMSRTQFEFGPTQINKSTPVDSDAELN